jgi:hypothetical protein
MEGKNDKTFDEVVAAYKAKNLRDIMAFRNNWNNEVIVNSLPPCMLRSGGHKKNPLDDRGEVV